ncbi:pyruvate, phosphate dikinase [Methanofollis fontis]|uniref:Pyruvate, phosphate dikinase n=2 Tax=Methanofollis fontis TaxID=2052832 RepID=A0A483CYS1_9EURY|nr:pyruvate, phosphate dikinase [Methanofollis fontis]
MPRMAMFGHTAREPVPAGAFGNKAAGLAEMAALGIPVPPGFVLNVEICEEFHRDGGVLPPDVPGLLGRGIAFLEEATDLSFGGARPLLVSVRSGAPLSMPGIMETVLDVGLTPDAVRGLIALTGNPRFAWNSCWRFVQNFGTTVLGRDPAVYAGLQQRALQAAGVPSLAGLDSFSLRDLVRAAVEEEGEAAFPADAHAQLTAATVAVLESWMRPRALSYRQMNLIRDGGGTAVCVQAMVFGNIGPRSGAGVGFSRNPWTGEPGALVDFAFGAQGEDVVSGAVSAASEEGLRRTMPEVCRRIAGTARILEAHFRDMQDFEFTVQEGALYLLQTRSGKRAPLAALRIAVDLWREGVITAAEGRERLREVDLDTLLVRVPVPDTPPLAAGTPASGGVVSGAAVFSAETAERAAERGPVIYVCDILSPDDLPVVGLSAGVLTARGSRTSHAAVVARQMGRVCIVNCAGLSIDRKNHRCLIGGESLSEGDVISLDGGSGQVYAGEVAVVEERPLDLLEVAEGWSGG